MFSAAIGMKYHPNSVFAKLSNEERQEVTRKMRRAAIECDRAEAADRRRQHWSAEDYEGGKV